MKGEGTKTWVVFFLVVLSAFSRLIPHPSNFTAIGALAIYSSLVFPYRGWGIVLPLLAMWISDLVINNVIYAAYQPQFVFFSEGFVWIYLGLVAHSVSALWLGKRKNIAGIASASVVGAVAFFLLSNFGVWAGSSMYPHSIEGLSACYVAALPFLGNFLAGNVFFCGVLFGIHYFLERNTRLFQMGV